jgi:tellurite resistance protein TehA-like permease
MSNLNILAVIIIIFVILLLIRLLMHFFWKEVIWELPNRFGHLKQDFRWFIGTLCLVFSGFLIYIDKPLWIIAVFIIGFLFMFGFSISIDHLEHEFRRLEEALRLIFQVLQNQRLIDADSWEEFRDDKKPEGQNE